MNGMRVARKYIKRLSDQELQGLYEATKNDESQEALVIKYLIICEIKRRKK